MALFLISESFALTARSEVFAIGEVLEGRIRVGQSVLEPAGLPAVAAVELALDAGPPRQERATLGFRYTSEAELERMRSLLAPGTTLTLAS